jgi:hypothetical protein
MSRFGGVDVVEELNGENVHRLENVMTMSANLHGLFDTLVIWFESTVSFPPMFEHNLAPYKSCRVTQTRTTSVPERPHISVLLPIQWCFLLNTKIFLCSHQDISVSMKQAAHLAGGWEYVDAILRDMEEVAVLASDGSSAHLLSSALQQKAGIVVC